MQRELIIKPHDLLFFRDAKPMAAGEGYGNGCNMPMPNILHSAIRSALLKQNGSLPDVKKTSQHSKDKDKKRKIGLDKFGSLQVKNLFTYHEKYGLLFPVPNDVLNAGDKKLVVTQLKKISDNVVCPVSIVPPNKDRISGLWTETQLMAYIAACYEPEINFTPVNQAEVWQEEWRVGIGINPESNSTMEGQLYAGAYMRMNDNAGFAAEVSINDKEGDFDDLMHIHFGGEKKLASIQMRKNIFPEWNCGQHENGTIVKWNLLTPAIFANGTLPGWIENSRVMLQPKSDGKKIAIDAKLLCCSAGSPSIFSGWDVIDQQAKPSLFAVQSGAVYYFECATPKDAECLAVALHGKNRSDMLSEQGFGFGITSIMEKNYE